MENEHTDGFYMIERARLRREIARAHSQRDTARATSQSSQKLLVKLRSFANPALIAKLYDMEQLTRAANASRELRCEILVLESDYYDTCMHLNVSASNRQINDAMDMAYRRRNRKINKLISKLSEHIR